MYSVIHVGGAKSRHFVNVIYDIFYCSIVKKKGEDEEEKKEKWKWFSHKINGGSKLRKVRKKLSKHLHLN